MIRQPVETETAERGRSPNPSTVIGPRKVFHLLKTASPENDLAVNLMTAKLEFPSRIIRIRPPERQLDDER